MKYYQPKKSELTPYARKMAVAIVQGYDQIQKELDSMISISVSMDGQPRGTKTSDPTGAAVMRRMKKRTTIEAIDKALLCVPPEYRKTVFEWVKTGATLMECGGDDAHRNTYSNWKEVFLREVAANMGWHEDWR